MTTQSVWVVKGVVIPMRTMSSPRTSRGVGRCVRRPHAAQSQSEPPVQSVTKTGDSEHYASEIDFPLCIANHQLPLRQPESVVDTPTDTESTHVDSDPNINSTSSLLPNVQNNTSNYSVVLYSPTFGTCIPPNWVTPTCHLPPPKQLGPLVPYEHLDTYKLSLTLTNTLSLLPSNLELSYRKILSDLDSIKPLRSDYII